jgi:hypothetical protein
MKNPDFKTALTTKDYKDILVANPILQLEFDNLYNKFLITQTNNNDTKAKAAISATASLGLFILLLIIQINFIASLMVSILLFLVSGGFVIFQTNEDFKPIEKIETAKQLPYIQDIMFAIKHKSYYKEELENIKIQIDSFIQDNEISFQEFDLTLIENMSSYSVLKQKIEDYKNSENQKKINHWKGVFDEKLKELEDFVIDKNDIKIEREYNSVIEYKEAIDKLRVIKSQVQLKYESAKSETQKYFLMIRPNLTQELVDEYFRLSEDDGSDNIRDWALLNMKVKRFILDMLDSYGS